MGTGAESDAAAVRPVELGPLGETISFVLRRANAVVSDHIQRGFAGEAIRPMLYAIMMALRHNPGARQTAVSAALGIKRTNFVPLFDELQDRGLAERRRVANDRRAAALFLTEEGETLLRRLDELGQRIEARFTARIGAEGRTQLLGLLHRLGDHAFDADNDEAAAG